MADWLGQAQGWDSKRKKEELKRSLEILADQHQVYFE
jgi:hypothetical protein